jgi:hypothetical protein
MEFLFLVLLVLLNGVFALSEMAIVSSRKPRLKAMADRGNLGAKTALRLLDDPSKLLSTVQIGITAIGVIAGAYGATALSDNFTPVVVSLLPGLERYAAAIAFGTVIVITTLLSLVLGELIPKRIALSAPEPLAALMAPAMALIATATSFGKAKSNLSLVTLPSSAAAAITKGVRFFIGLLGPKAKAHCSLATSCKSSLTAATSASCTATPTSSPCPPAKCNTLCRPLIPLPLTAFMAPGGGG